MMNDESQLPHNSKINRQTVVADSGATGHMGRCDKGMFDIEYTNKKVRVVKNSTATVIKKEKKAEEDRLAAKKKKKAKEERLAAEKKKKPEEEKVAIEKGKMVDEAVLQSLFGDTEKQLD